MADDGSSALDEIALATRRMRSLDLLPLQPEILQNLMDGERTLSELVMSIFGVKRGDEGFDTYYGKLRRAISGLENSGYVSRRGIFGREKPYHITLYGVAKIAAISPSMPKPRILTKIDVLVYIATLIAGLVSVVVSGTGRGAWVVSLCVFFFLAGVAVTRSGYLLRKVI